MNRFSKKMRVAVGVIALTMVAAGAYAYWTGGGSGSGTSDVGTNGAVTITATVAPDIAPGEARAVSFTAANATTSPIFVTTVHLVSVAVDSEHAACATADFSMANVTASHQVPAGATVEALGTGGSLVYANTAVSQDACKDATLTLTLSST